MRAIHRRWVWLGIAAGLMLIASASAQQGDVLTPVSGEFNELYLQNPKVSGSLLVGVLWDAPQGTYDPQKILVSLPSQSNISNICVELASKDGRYTAEGLFDVPKGVTRQKEIGRPLRLKYKTKYGAKLREYQVSDIAVLVREAVSCGAINAGRVLPAIVMPSGSANLKASPDSRKLVIYLNADPDRIHIALQPLGGIEPKADCKGVGESVHIAYRARCTLVLPEILAQQNYELEIRKTESFKTVPTKFSIWLTP
jgi:hypothetical protein